MIETEIVAVTDGVTRLANDYRSSVQAVATAEANNAQLQSTIAAMQNLLVPRQTFAWNWNGTLTGFSRVQGAAGLAVGTDTANNRPMLICTLRKTDPLDSGGKRAEGLLSSDGGAPWIVLPGDETETRWSLMFPSDFRADARWQVYGQLHHRGTSGSPPWAFEVHGERMRIRLTPVVGDDAAGVVWQAPLVRGQWLNFVHRTSWSTVDLYSSNEVLLNGQTVVPKTRRANMFDTGNFLKMGAYRDDNIDFDQQVFWAGMSLTIRRAI